MRYLPDTNVWIRLLKGRSAKLLRNFERVDKSTIAMCSVVKYELQVGIAKRLWSDAVLARGEQFLSRYTSLPLDDSAAVIAGNIRGYLEHKGMKIGPYDYLIAATAIENDLIVVTNNVSEFSRIPDLRWEDWET